MYKITHILEFLLKPGFKPIKLPTMNSKTLRYTCEFIIEGTLYDKL